MDSESLDQIVGNSDEIKWLCFTFFMAFSRFEFALKENGYRQEGRFGQVEPAWRRFCERFAAEYQHSEAALRLMAAPPRQQVLNGGNLDWKAIDVTRERTEIGQITLVLKTIRNNLFHGGKCGAEDWDNRLRTVFLLRNGVLVLDSLAELGQMIHDYERRY